jgi:hypothetical protein
MSHEPATAEQKADTGPLPVLPSAPSGPPNRRPAVRPVWLAVGGLIALLAGVALFALRPSDPLADARPVTQVQGFVAAMEARDATAMLSFLEPSVLKKQIGPEVRAYVEYIRELRFEDARYEVLENNGERARVRMTATMQYTLDYGETRSGTHPVDSIYELRLIEGAWYISGVQLPQA